MSMGGAAYTPGDREAFERLYLATYPRVVRTLRGLLSPAAAEDCAQEAYAKAFKAWPDLKPGGSAEAWIFRIAINTGLSHRRRDRLVGFVSLFLPGVFERLEGKGGWDTEVTEAVRALPAKLGATVLLRYYHGYGPGEIASMLGISERTVRWRLNEAMGKLKKNLEAGIADLDVADRLSS